MNEEEEEELTKYEQAMTALEAAPETCTEASLIPPTPLGPGSVP